MILSGGTAYQSDAGMCGDYDSVIGMDKTVPIERFVKKVKGERLSVAGGEGTLCAVFVETDDSTGFARRVAPVRLGGRLAETRSEEHTSELQSLMRISYAVFCLTKQNKTGRMNVDGMNIISNYDTNKLKRSRKKRATYKVQSHINTRINAASNTTAVNSNPNYVT